MYLTLFTGSAGEVAASTWFAVLEIADGYMQNDTTLRTAQSV